MTETERQLRDERNELIRKCARLTKALDSASRVAYSRGYIQGVSDAVVDHPDARAMADAMVRRGMGQP